ncbi:MAG: phosphomannomutase/phosphoglucomutase [Methyloglobulus sp.]|nr:phosphomannomutase/phosphoglucomutase [Methyloglobulus sp.]
MERMFSVLTLTAVLMVLLAGGGIYLSSKVIIAQAKEEAALASAQQVSQTLSKQISLLESSLDKMAQDPDVLAAVAHADAGNLNSTASRLEKYLPGVRKIRLFPVGTIEADQTNAPRMGYGDLDMVKGTFQENPLPAIQGDIGPDRHLAITRKILQGNQTVGVILASMSFDFINQNLKDAVTGDNYMELRQAKLVLSNIGNKGESEDFKQINVPNSSWDLYYRDPASGNLGSLGVILGFMIIPALLVLGVFYVCYRQLSIMLTQDQDWLLQAFKDVLTDKPKGSYPVSLNGMNGVIASMVRFNREVEKRGVVAARNADNDNFELEGFLGDLPEVPAIAQNEQASLTVIEPEKSLEPPIEKDDKMIEHQLLDLPEVIEEIPQPIDEKAAMFRAYDIRGIVGKTLTTEIVHDIGRALGSEAKESGCKIIVVGRDGRMSSPGLAEALSQGIISTGCTVLDIGMVPTPVLYFVVQHTDGRSGVMITGSHNPAEYNGLKMMIKGDTLSGARIQQLKQRIDNQAYVTGSTGTIEQNGMFAGEYIGTVNEDIQLNRPMKIVLDCGNGVAGELGPALFKSLGCEVVPLFCEIDGNFPNHHPDPSKPENLEDLIAAVKEHNADIGIAFDGDGDRLGVIDSDGNIIWPDRQMMLFAKDVLAGKPGSEIIYDVKCSRHLPDQIVKYGGRPLMWKTGHSFMKAKLKETGAKLAGEMSGHIFFNDRWFGFDDALYSAARLLQILSEEDQSSAEVFATFPNSINTPELNVLLTEGENFKFIDSMFANASFKGGKVTDIDGMRIDFSDGWGLVRASNTTPSLVIRFEADNTDALAKIQEQFRQLMQKIKPDIQLPF